MSLTDAFGTDIAHNGDLVRTSGGDVATVTGLANMEQALFHRLITVPGTLIHRPTYGVGAPLYQGAISSFAAQQKFAQNIKEQFLQDPRVLAVTSISISTNDSNPQQTLVKVFVTLVGYIDAIPMEFTPFSGGL